MTGPVEDGLAGVVALVTGASKGIGLACARRLAASGARVVGVARGQETLAAARESLAADGLEMAVEAADLSDGQAAARLVERVESAYGPVGLLVNSAGAARRFALDELDAVAFRQGMDAKYFSTVNVLEPAIRRMGERRAGSIVNIIGQGGRRAASTHIPGGAANAALMLATVGYASAYAGRGVRVNGINPGLTRTSRVDEGLEAAARATGRDKESLLAEAIAGIPMGRMAEPAEVAEVAAFLLSTRASYVTGAIVPMDGGGAAVP